MFFIRLPREGANFESRMLNHLASCVLMILFLAIVATGLRWLAEVRKSPTDELLFEEEIAAEIIVLKLT